MRIAPASLLAAALALPAVAAAQPLPIDYLLPAPAGQARLVLPGEGGGPLPLVILLPDSLGEEVRSDRYVDALAARGIASLVLGLGNDPEGRAPPADPAASAAAATVARDWAMHGQPPFEPAAIGLLGIGAGARAALAAAAIGPVVALDPGCAGLALPAWSPVLVVHGLATADAAACAALPEPPATTILGLPGVGHGWDLPLALMPGGALQPDPAGEGRRRARPDPVATGLVAEQAAAWLFLQLHERGRPQR